MCMHYLRQETQSSRYWASAPSCHWHLLVEIMSLSLSFSLLKGYLRVREGKGAVGVAEGERDSPTNSLLSAEPDAGLHLRTLRS